MVESCVCVCVCVCVCEHVCMCDIHVHVCVCVCVVCICMGVGRACMSVYVCTYVWVMVRVYVRVCVCSLRKGRGKSIWGEMVPCGQKQVIVQTTIQSLQSVSTGRGSWGAERERERQTDRQRDRERASASGLRDVDWRLVWRQRFCLLPEHLKAVEGDTIQSTFLELQLPECKLILRGWLLSALWKLALAGCDSPGDCASL